MKETRLAIKILKTLTKDRLQYPGRLMVDTLTVISRCGILLLLYWYVYNLKGGLINGTSFVFVAWSIFFYFSFSTLRLRDIARQIMVDIQSGNVEVLFSKPVSYLSYRAWWQIGLGLYSFLVITAVAGLGLYLLIGLPFTMTLSLFLPTLILTFLFAGALSLLIYIAVGLLAFWIEDVNPVFWIVDKAIMILGGSYLPVALFPPLMYKMALYSPFGASQFVTHTVNESWASNWYQLIGIQIFWIIIISIVVYFMFEQAKKKVSVNGG
ncbi:MAG: hypothetical protein WCV68_00460 [Candidatus Paceibacterota bacterium]|jgi:ABC-2 type transport system permease protein